MVIENVHTLSSEWKKQSKIITLQQPTLMLKQTIQIDLLRVPKWQPYDLIEFMKQ